MKTLEQNDDAERGFRSLRERLRSAAQIRYSNSEKELEIVKDAVRDQFAKETTAEPSIEEHLRSKGLLSKQSSGLRRSDKNRHGYPGGNTPVQVECPACKKSLPLSRGTLRRASDPESSNRFRSVFCPHCEKLIPRETLVKAAKKAGIIRIKPTSA